MQGENIEMTANDKHQWELEQSSSPGWKISWRSICRGAKIWATVQLLRADVRKSFILQLGTAEKVAEIDRASSSHEGAGTRQVIWNRYLCNEDHFSPSHHGDAKVLTMLVGVEVQVLSQRGPPRRRVGIPNFHSIISQRRTYGNSYKVFSLVVLDFYLKVHW